MIWSLRELDLGSQRRKSRINVKKNSAGFGKNAEAKKEIRLRSFFFLTETFDIFLFGMKQIGEIIQ